MSTCDSPDLAEWSIAFMSSSFNKQQDTTLFTWLVSTSKTLPKDSCAPSNTPVALQNVIIRLGCDCEPQSSTYLRSITRGTSPAADIASDYWRFGNLNVAPGQTKQLQIVLQGNVTRKNNGDATLGGGMRCVSTENAFPVVVPNPCSNVCNFGKWTDWKKIGSCSVSCGGGEQKRQRDCVSLCNDNVLVNNCQGISNDVVPCNTQACPAWNGKTYNEVDNVDESGEGWFGSWWYP